MLLFLLNNKQFENSKRENYVSIDYDNREMILFPHWIKNRNIHTFNVHFLGWMWSVRCIGLFISTAGISMKRSVVRPSVDLVHLSNVYKVMRINIYTSRSIPQISDQGDDMHAGVHLGAAGSWGIQVGSYRGGNHLSGKKDNQGKLQRVWWDNGRFFPATLYGEVTWYSTSTG